MQADTSTEPWLTYRSYCFRPIELRCIIFNLAMLSDESEVAIRHDPIGSIAAILKDQIQNSMETREFDNGHLVFLRALDCQFHTNHMNDAWEAATEISDRSIETGRQLANAIDLARLSRLEQVDQVLEDVVSDIESVSTAARDHREIVDEKRQQDIREARRRNQDARLRRQRQGRTTGRKDNG